MNDSSHEFDPDANDVAIVGMSAHLPGAASIDEFWQNLRGGVESIRKLTEAELLAAGENPARINQRNYVPSAAILDNFEQFDADFFGFSPKEAAIMDPQHRQFLECAWEALENAGHPPENFDGPIGVYAGSGMGSYFYFNVCSNPDLVRDTGMFLLRHTGNDKDFMATRLSHVLDLKGPSINLQTACSTSLVATHYACAALLNGECDMALAGGATVELPHGRGYLFEEGEILSPDGHCHAFDARAEGTVFGSGAGVVVLRRLADAIADGDHIWGVIKGSSVNNDGAAKAGYLAPSVDGQAAAIAEAQAIADVPANTVDYIECHGTGTFLGDPIEVAALTAAFRQTTNDTGFCKIGSVKTNIGHLDTAAGVASLIKVALSLHHKELPASLGFESPNPAIDFDNSPFQVNSQLTDWVETDHPRRAGVNSLGVGGTNAHAVLQEAPIPTPSDDAEWPVQIITISGRNNAALDANAAALSAHLRANPDQPLVDVAFTLKEGRRAFEKRRTLVAATHEEAAEMLDANDPRRVFNHTTIDTPPKPVFMFPGGGSQYVGMAKDLYFTEPVFAEWMDRGLDILQPQVDYDVRALWLAEGNAAKQAEKILTRPSVQLPLIMIVEYSLAQLWMSWGVEPDALVGHSMGENTAACLAGVIGYEDCIGLVLLRGQLFDTVPAGGMLSVGMAANDLGELLDGNLEIAGINAPELTVVSGPDGSLKKLAEILAAQDIDCQRIPIDIAAHSSMLEPILGRFGDYLRSIRLSAPNIPIISNRSGQVLSDEDAVDPDYWVSHLRNAVLFADCISTLSQDPARIFLEVGPGKALSSLTRIHGSAPANQILSSLRHVDEMIEDDVYFLGIIGRLWALGYQADWSQYWGDGRRNRVPLPTYQFQRSPYFIEPSKTASEEPLAPLMRQDDIADWGYRVAWKPEFADCDLDIATELDQASRESWLIFMDTVGLGTAIAKRLRDADQSVVEVYAGDTFAPIGAHSYVLSPERGREGYDALLADLVANGRAPNRIVHLWLVTGDESHRPGGSFFHKNQEQGFYSLLFLAQAIATENLPTPVHITTLTNGAVSVRGEALSYPEKATSVGPLGVIPREMPGVTCAGIDIELNLPRKRKSETLDKLALRVLEDLVAPARNARLAYRGDRRFTQTLRKIELAGKTEPQVFREKGVYLITGGFGGIGLTLAQRLIKDFDAKIVLLSRQKLPEENEWAAYLAKNAPTDTVYKNITALQNLREMGGAVAALNADVSNIAEMRQIVRDIAETFGAINGVIHAAGVIDDGPLLAKTSASIENVFTPKIHGTEVINQLFPDGSLDFLALFASTSTITTPAGQIDYVAANEYFNALAQSRSGGKTPVFAINWGVWAEIGMAAGSMSDRTDPSAPATVEIIENPLLDNQSFDVAGNRIFNARFDAQDDWILNEHRTKSGQALLPGTGFIELAAQAMLEQGETGPFAVRDLMFLRPFEVAETGGRDLRVKLQRNDAGYDFEVQGGVISGGKQGFQLLAQAQIGLGTQEVPSPLNLGSISERCGERNHAENGQAIPSAQSKHLQFGSRWQVLQEIEVGQGEGLARLKLPTDAQVDLNVGYQLHPALLDIATGWAMELIDGYKSANLWVPMSYGMIRVYQPLGAEVLSWVRNAATNYSTDDVAEFDITLCDADGNVCVEISRFAIKKLANTAGFAQAGHAGSDDVVFDQDPNQQKPLSAAEELLHHNISQGIRPADGAEAFMRAMSMDQRQIYISSLELPDLIQQTATSMFTAEDTNQQFARPNLDTEFIAPRNDVERTLAGFWQTLLGVDEIGMDDSFFDLGGHSLIAVRLFAMVKKAYQVDFPISVLFQAPTIGKCAAMIIERVGEPNSNEAVQTTSVPKLARRFTHLVPMHDGEGGTARPFFLVAGMFGNVLNLRHLAQLVGADRPFYGLQARGLYGEDAPHDDLKTAAADCIAEIKVVQPEGPYLLGGFSGGGLTAFEIAQQLEAAGDTVSLVALLDTPLPVRRILAGKDRLIVQWQELRRRGFSYPFVWAANRLRWEISKRRASDLSVSETTAPTFHNAAIEASFMTAVSSYEMQPWNGAMVLYRPPLVGKWRVSGGQWVDDQRAYLFDDNDWGQFVPDIKVVEVPGDHDSMVLEPNVRVLAAALKTQIALAEEKNNGATLLKVAE